MFDLKSIRTKEDNLAKYYVLEDKGLENAVQMAIWLSKPLLLTGAPGTGKTQLAYKIADMLGSKENETVENIPTFLDKLFVFHTKTTSVATDLFYYYDAVRHFQKRYVDDQDHIRRSVSVTQKVQVANTNDSDLITNKIESIEPSLTAHSFIKLHALGKAILQAWGKDAILSNDELKDLKNLAGFDELDNSPRSSVVLIDEIDKASRDFPNDLLFEIENMSFYINELMNKLIPKPDTNAQVIVIMTSNFEKNLPDAFLRRCLFYHISFPEIGSLIKIVSSRIKPHLQELYKDNKQLEYIIENLDYNLIATIEEFEKIRNEMNDKQPATAELLEWIKMLEKQGFYNEKIDFKKLSKYQNDILKLSFSVIAKSEADINILKKRYSKMA